ncbi:MAG: hypothetical protein R3211_01110 [Balneolaceae bacterium]|nr:hypothetical protein [Balneolaceae bacterium]
MMIFIAAGCSSSGNVQSSQGEAEPEVGKMAPPWYRTSPAVSKDHMIYSSHATALGSDSTSAISKAEAGAIAVMERALSEKLESIRQKAARQQSDAGLGKSAFILDLRSAEARISSISRTGNTGVIPASDGYRGFAEVQVNRSDLITLIESALDEHTAAWKAMQSNPAFAEL